MAERRVTIIVSDLHMSTGAPGDDFVYQGSQFPDFVRGLAASAEGKSGQIELFLNGDFLDFVQANEAAYTLSSARYWCSQDESDRKLDTILKGHSAVFATLKDFLVPGNAVTLIPGNHDVDIYWPRVQKRLCEAAGDIAIDCKPVWHHRYQGRLRIAHGNHIDPANRFENSENPVLWAEPGLWRLEMCAGTLFVVKFVNWLSAQYPFANNVHPATRLGRILLKEDRFGFSAAAWMLSRFSVRHAKSILSTGSTADLGEHLVGLIRLDRSFAQAALEIFRKLRNPGASLQQMRDELKDSDAMARFMMDSLAVTAPQDWLALFDDARPQTAAAGGSAQTLLIRESGGLENEHWQNEAKEQWKDGAEIVVMGHTHLPDTLEQNGRRYYNPGSWTRYLNVENLDTVRLKDLEDEEKFPYQLNYVRVELANSGALISSMTCVDKYPREPS